MIGSREIEVESAGCGQVLRVLLLLLAFQVIGCH